MGILFTSLLDPFIKAVGNIILALIVWFAGSWLIHRIMVFVDKFNISRALDATVQSFTKNVIKILMYVILVISVIGILGVPMASIVTALASAGVAIGLALQGALSNLAGGIMILIFRPFGVGDYISTSSGDGTVAETTLFYTILTTPDNCRINIPNGSMMNAAVKNFSSAEHRRVDLKFTCSRNEEPAHIQKILLEVLNRHPSVLSDPSPFARFSGTTNEALEFTVRVWVDKDNYWDVYYDLLQDTVEAFIKAGVKAPAVRYINDTNKKEDTYHV